MNTNEDLELRTANAALRQQVKQRVDTLRIVQDVAIAANEADTVEEAIRATLQIVCDYNNWCIGHAYVLAEDGSDQMVSSGIWVIDDSEGMSDADKRLLSDMAAEVRFSAGEGIIGRVMQSGEPEWVDDIESSESWRRRSPLPAGVRAAAAFPVLLEARVVAVLEFYASDRISHEPEFIQIMHTIGIQLGHVIKRRKLELEVAATLEREQRRIGSDIHDGLGQELTGLRYIAQTHADTLAAQGSPEAEVARRIAQGFHSLQQSLRGIVKDLVPVEMDGGGLVPALEALAAQTTENSHLQCSFHCENESATNDFFEALPAIHLYRIAQEAIGNAVRHAQANSVEIRIRRDPQALLLQIIDNGMGIGNGLHPRSGIGLRSMRHRAGLLGGQLTIENRSEGGAIVTCMIPEWKP